MKKNTLIVLSVIFLVSLSQAAFAKDPQPQYGGVLNLVNQRSIGIIGYPPQVRGYSVKFNYCCLEQLCFTDSKGQFAPTKLSTSYKLTDDGKTLIFNLRKGVKFHDGTDWNAKAAKWNLDNAKAGKKPGTSLWKSIEIIDNYTIRVRFTEFQNSWPSVFASISQMVSPTAVQKNGEKWAYYHPVGTGPFKFKGFKRDVFVEYERYDDYWGGKPYLDGIKYNIIKDPMTQMAAFVRGEVDVLETVSTKVLNDLKAKGYKIESEFVVLSVLHPDSANPDSPFADQRVREAVEYAIDRPAIVKAISYGFWKALNQPCLSENMAYNPDLAGRRYNPEKAKKLLAEAGYSKGFKTQIILTSPEKNEATLLQAFLKDVGITADLNTVDRGRLMEYDTQGWHNGILLKNWGIDPNYTNTFVRFLEVDGLRSKSVLRPDGWGDMLAKALAAKDFETHKALTQKAVKFAHDKAMVVPLWEQPNSAVHQEYVYNTNFFTPRLMEWTYDKAYISK